MPGVNRTTPKVFEEKAPRKLTIRHRRLWFHAINNDVHFRNLDPLLCDTDAARLFQTSSVAPQEKQEFSTTKRCRIGTGQGRDVTAGSDEVKLRSDAGNVCSPTTLTTGQEQDRCEAKAPIKVQFVNWLPSTQTTPQPDLEHNDSSRIFYDHSVDCDILRGSSSKEMFFGLAAKERICIHSFYVSRQGEASRLTSLCAGYNSASEAINHKILVAREQNCASMKCSGNEITLTPKSNDRSVHSSEDSAQLSREEIPTDRPASTGSITVSVDLEMELRASCIEYYPAVRDVLENLITAVVVQVAHSTEHDHIEKSSSSEVEESATWIVGHTDQSSFDKTPTGSSVFEHNDLTDVEKIPSKEDSSLGISSRTLSSNTNVTRVTELKRMASFTESDYQIFSETSVTDRDLMTHSGSQDDPTVNVSKQTGDEDHSDAEPRNGTAEDDTTGNPGKHQPEEQNTVYEWVEWFHDIVNTSWIVC